MKNLNELAKQVNQANIKWWQNLETGEPIQRNKGELLMLVITELAEAVEGIRKNLQDDKLPDRKMEEVEMADAYIRLLDFAGGFNIDLTDKTRNEEISEDEMVVKDFKTGNKAEQILAICGQICRTSYSFNKEELAENILIALYVIELYCFNHGLDLMGAYEAKMLYNKTRIDHTIEARKAAGGKKF